MNNLPIYTNGHGIRRTNKGRSNRHVDSAIVPGKVRQPIQAYVPQRNGRGVNGRFKSNHIDSALALPPRRQC